MKAGLLVCDHVNPESRDRFGDYPDMYAALLPALEWRLYDACNGQVPEDVNECDLYMATGSRYSVYDNLDWIVALKAFVRSLYDQDKCFIGCCFGHQLMGEALGGKVEKSPNGWCVGVHQFDIINPESWMKPFQANLNLLMMCQDQVTELPKDATVLASSPLCPVAMFRIGRRMLGIQAHPEFSKEYDQMLMETRMNKMGDEVALGGIESLSLPVHSSIVGDWVMNFLKSVRH